MGAPHVTGVVALVRGHTGMELSTRHPASSRTAEPIAALAASP